MLDAPKKKRSDPNIWGFTYGSYLGQPYRSQICCLSSRRLWIVDSLCYFCRHPYKIVYLDTILETRCCLPISTLAHSKTPIGTCHPIESDWAGLYGFYNSSLLSTSPILSRTFLNNITTPDPIPGRARDAQISKSSKLGATERMSEFLDSLVAITPNPYYLRLLNKWSCFWAVPRSRRFIQPTIITTMFVGKIWEEEKKSKVTNTPCFDGGRVAQPLALVGFPSETPLKVCSFYISGSYLVGENFSDVLIYC